MHIDPTHPSSQTIQVLLSNNAIKQWTCTSWHRIQRVPPLSPPSSTTDSCSSLAIHSGNHNKHGDWYLPCVWDVKHEIAVWCHYILLCALLVAKSITLDDIQHDINPYLDYNAQPSFYGCRIWVAGVWWMDKHLILRIYHIYHFWIFLHFFDILLDINLYKKH